MFESIGSLDQFIGMALASDTYQSLTRAGGGIILFGFLIALILEWVKFYKGDRADWGTPIVTVAMTSFSLAIFPFAVHMIIAFGGSFGDLKSGTELASQVFTDRTDRLLLVMGQKASSEEKTSTERIYGSSMKDHLRASGRYDLLGETPPSSEDDTAIKGTESGFFDSMMNDIKASLLYYVALILKYITVALVRSVQVIQALLLKVLIYLGPIMISFGAVPGPFKRLPMNWFMMFFTISFWSVVMNGLLFMLAKTTEQMPLNGAVNLSEEIIVSFVWIFMIISVPAFSTALINGSGFSGVLGESTSAASGFIAGKASSAWNFAKSRIGGK